MTSLKHKTISGVKWTFVSSIAQRILSLGSTVVLARVLTPADFGLFALAFVMIDGFGIFKSLGFDSALIRRKDDIPKAANTAFFLIPAMGIILFLILFLIAPLGAKLLGNPDVGSVIRALAFIFVISCFGKVPQTMLYRDMKFKYKAIAEISAHIVYISLAVILALAKFGVWSLVIAYILKNLVQISIEWFFSGWKPKLEFDRHLAGEMFHFGKFVLASGIIWFLFSNLDNLVIGRLLGVTILGFYALSMNISNLLNDYLLGKVGMIMYPAYSRIQDDTEDVKRVMLKGLRYISIIAFPFSFGLFIFAPDILRVVFGAKWLPAVNILRILSVVGMFRSLGSSIWPIFLAKGRSKADFQVGLAHVGVFFVLVIPLAVKFQLTGVGAAVLLSAIISFVIGLVRVKRIIHIEIYKIFEAVKPALFSSLLIFPAVILSKAWIVTPYSIFNLLSSGILAALIYLFAVYSMNKNILKEIKETLFVSEG